MSELLKLLVATLKRLCEVNNTWIYVNILQYINIIYKNYPTYSQC
jgi:hypothetical protein